MPAEPASLFLVRSRCRRSFLTARPNARSCTPTSSSFRASVTRRSNSSSVNPFSPIIVRTFAKKARRTTSSPGYVHSVMVVLPKLLKTFGQEGESDSHQCHEPKARQKERGQTEQHEVEAQEATELFNLSRGREFNVGWKREHRLRPPRGDLRDAQPCSRTVYYSTMRLSHGASCSRTLWLGMRWCCKHQRVPLTMTVRQPLFSVNHKIG